MTLPHGYNEIGRRWQLQRFGYGDVASPAKVWRQLRGDFAEQGAQVDLEALPTRAREAAERYCAHRSNLDGLMDRCDQVHQEILNAGPRQDLVEAYAEARDAYEDAVETFGELRVAFEWALRGN